MILSTIGWARMNLTRRRKRTLARMAKETIAATWTTHRGLGGNEQRRGYAHRCSPNAKRSSKLTTR